MVRLWLRYGWRAWLRAWLVYRVWLRTMVEKHGWGAWFRMGKKWWSKKGRYFSTNESLSLHERLVPMPYQGISRHQTSAHQTRTLSVSRHPFRRRVLIWQKLCVQTRWQQIGRRFLWGYRWTSSLLPSPYRRLRWRLDQQHRWQRRRPTWFLDHTMELFQKQQNLSLFSQMAEDICEGETIVPWWGNFYFPYRGYIRKCEFNIRYINVSSHSPNTTTIAQSPILFLVVYNKV